MTPNSPPGTQCDDRLIPHPVLDEEIHLSERIAVLRRTPRKPHVASQAEVTGLLRGVAVALAGPATHLLVAELGSSLTCGRDLAAACTVALSKVNTLSLGFQRLLTNCH